MSCRKHELLDEDITAHGERIKDLNAQWQEFIDTDIGDSDDIKDRRESINERYVKVQVGVVVKCCA